MFLEHWLRGSGGETRVTHACPLSTMAATIDFSILPSKQADLAETWTYLNAGVDHIMNTLEKGLSFAGYTNLYTTVYNYCTATKMNGKIDGNRCESLSAKSYKSDSCLTQQLEQILLALICTISLANILSRTLNQCCWYVSSVHPNSMV